MNSFDPTQREGSEKVRVTDPDTGRAYWRLTVAPMHDRHAYYDVSPWNPVDGRIVFSSALHEEMPDPWNRMVPTNKGHLFVMDADGGNITWIAGGIPFIFHSGAFPQWTHDGEHVACRDYSGEAMEILDLAGHRLDRVENFAPRQLSPDDRQMAGFCERDGVVILSMATLKREIVIDFPTILSATPCRAAGERNVRERFRRLVAANTKWSPDGSRIIFRASGWYTANEEEMRELYAMNADGTDLHCIEGAAGRFHHHSWHPDGQRILFAAHTAEDQQRLFFVDYDGRNLTQISDANIGGHPAINPDGTRIVSERVKDGIYLIDVATGQAEKLVQYPYPKAPIDPHMIWKADGTQILFGSSVSGLSQLYLMDM